MSVINVTQWTPRCNIVQNLRCDFTKELREFSAPTLHVPGTDNGSSVTTSGTNRARIFASLMINCEE